MCVCVGGGSDVIKHSVISEKSGITAHRMGGSFANHVSEKGIVLRIYE